MNTNKLLQTMRSGWSPIVVIAVTTLAIIAISIYCLVSGYFIIFQNLFYIPIIIACVYYTKRGFVFSVIIACLYFLLTIAFTRESLILLQALARALIFVLVAGVITYLSLARKRVEESLRRQHDNLEGLVQERTAQLEEDNAKRKQAEEALRESEKQVRRKLDAILSPEANISALELSDIIDSEKIQKLMDQLYKVTHMGIGIIDLHGRVLVGTGWQDICTQFHRINPESCRLCMESDLELSRDVPVGTFNLYRCKNNMWDMATPIKLGGLHMGNIFLGQFLFDDETVDYETFRQQAVRYGFDEKEYIAALDRASRWSRETVDALMSFYSAFAEMIGNLSYGNVKLASALEERKQAEATLHAKNEELKAVTQQLWQAAKLATMGELASSIAHELNNPLATVSLRIESLSAQTSQDDKRLRELKIIGQEIERMGNLVTNLLQFSRRSRQQISTVDVREEIEKTFELLEYHLRKNNVKVIREFAPDVPFIHADRQQLRQLFLNLFTNAGDAMPQGGTLTVRVMARPEAKQVYIEIADTGIGIPPEILPKVMEAFFTTKPEGKGTGLGLAICRRIAQEHQGTFDIVSEGIPGKGTRVCIALSVSNGTNSKSLRDE